MFIFQMLSSNTVFVFFNLVSREIIFTTTFKIFKCKLFSLKKKKCFVYLNRNQYTSQADGNSEIQGNNGKICVHTVQ